MVLGIRGNALKFTNGGWGSLSSGLGVSSHDRYVIIGEDLRAHVYVFNVP